MTQAMLAILGGQGPLATARLLSMLTEAAIQRGAVQDADFLPTLTLNLPSQLNDHGAWSEAEERTFLDRNIAIIKAAGATHVVMPCNTMHVHEAYIREQLGDNINFISLRQLLIEQVGLPVQIWISDRARSADLYAPLVAQGAAYATDQALVDAAILAGMTGSALPAAPEHVGTLLLACTDLSVHAQYLRDMGHEVIDSLELLTEHVLEQLA